MISGYYYFLNFVLLFLTFENHTILGSNFWWWQLCLEVTAPLSIECIFSGSQPSPLSIVIARLSFIGKGVWDPQKMLSLRFFLTFPNQKRQLHSKVLNWTKRSGSTRRAHSLCYSFPCATYFSLCKLLIEAVPFKALTAQKGEYYSIKM